MTTHLYISRLSTDLKNPPEKLKIKIKLISFFFKKKNLEKNKFK